MATQGSDLGEEMTKPCVSCGAPVGIYRTQMEELRLPAFCPRCIRRFNLDSEDDRTTGPELERYVRELVKVVL